MRRSVSNCLVVVLAAAAPAHAEIFLESSPPTILPQGGLVSYTINAYSTAGETIVGVRNPSIVPYIGAGLHQVWPVPNFATPTRQEHLSAGALWNDSWRPFDSYFFFDNANSISVGSFTETNSAANDIGLPDSGFGPPITGFGSYGVSSASAGKIFTMASGLQGDNVAFAQLVLKSTESVSVSLDVLTSGGTADMHFNDFIVGGCCPPPVQLGDMDLGNVQRGTVVMASLLLENWSAELFDWELISFNGIGATVDPATGKFNWDSTGAPFGTYTAVISASHFEIGGDTGMLTFNLVPEPATMTLVGLAMIGLVGFSRRA